MPCGRSKGGWLWKVILGLVVILVTTLISASSQAALGQDDYKFRNDEWCATWVDSTCTSQYVDEWNFYKRECTSFVAWRLVNDNGMSNFRNTMVGPNGQSRTLGDAGNWGAAAQAMGYPVNMTPAPGSVAWWDSGHVAWVRSVDGDNVVVEEYNYNFTHAYMAPNRTIPKDSVSGYIHFKDLIGGSPDWHQQSDGLWTGTPPDGMIVESVEGNHLYVAAGGALFWYDRNNGYLGEAFLAQRRRLYGEIVFPRMAATKVHELEANYPSTRHRVPRDNTYLYEIGNVQQYVMTYGYSFPVSEGDLNYMGGRDRAIAIPPHNIQYFTGLPNIPNDVLLKDHLHPEVYHVVWDTLHYANSDTVIDCVKVVKGGALRPVPVSFLDRLLQAGRYSGGVTGCSFPENIALYGPGGVERWRITGNNPYVRARYADHAAMFCWLGSNPPQIQISTNGLNSIPEAAPLACSYEGKQLRSPDGRIWWIKNGIRRELPNQSVVNCLKGRVGTGDVLNVSWETVASHFIGPWAHCPYGLGTNFVKEADSPTVWRIYPDGRREHANGFCVPDPFTTNLYKYRVWVVPNGEAQGHSWDGTVFGVTPQSCQALPSP